MSKASKMAASNVTPIKKKMGGWRPGAGRKPGKGMNGVKGAIAALKRARLPEGATKEEQDLIADATKVIYEVMMHPQRYSQTQLAAATGVIDQVCGKIADRQKIESQSVTVVIHENPRPQSQPQDPPAPAPGAVEGAAQADTVATAPAKE